MQHATNVNESNQEDNFTIGWSKVNARVEIAQSEQYFKKCSSYTLFLFPDPRWCKKNNASINMLYEQFKYFGDAVGKDNLAIWFWRTDGEKLHADELASFDIATKLKLDINDGPYIVFIKPKKTLTNTLQIDRLNNVEELKMPRGEFLKVISLAGTAESYFVINLNELTSDCAIDLLRNLQRYLRHEDTVNMQQLSWDKFSCERGLELTILFKNLGATGEKIARYFTEVELEAKGFRIHWKTI